MRCSTYGLPAPGLHSVLALALLAALGCSPDELPTGPQAAGSPELAVSATATLVFRQILAGENHSCGVTTDNRAFCWGSNYLGLLGDNGGVSSNVPVAVAGGLSFRHVSVGPLHTCGVTTGDKAYCWGHGGAGALGDGTGSEHHTP